VRALFAIASLLTLTTPWSARAQNAAPVETFLGEATITSTGDFEAYAPMRVTITRFATDADRDALKASLKRGGMPEARELLSKAGDAGVVQVGSRRSAVKYAYTKSTSSGRVITIVTLEPLMVISSGSPSPMTGHELGLVILVTTRSGPGHGELVPATNIRIDQQGTVATDDYSGRVVSISNVITH
jgi:hypothetical protein